MENLKGRKSGGMSFNKKQTQNDIHGKEVNEKSLKRTRDGSEERILPKTKKTKFAQQEAKRGHILLNKNKSNTTDIKKSDGKVSKNGAKAKEVKRAVKKIVKESDDESDEEIESDGDVIDTSNSIAIKGGKDIEEEFDYSDNEEGDDEENSDEEDGGDNSDDNGDHSDDDVVEAINKKATKLEKDTKKTIKIDDDDEEDEEEEEDVSDSSSDDESDDDEEDSSSSSSSSEDEEAEEDDNAIPWGEMAADAPMTEESTKRLALCNMDWEHVKAIDIFVLFNSFKPETGAIKSVKVYPSDFGTERMKIEQEEGPIKLIGTAKNEEEQLNNLRKYEMDKLKYYYAVIACDSVETADAIYKSCDGMQFLESGVSVDLRFIPEDMTFEQKPASVAKSMPADGSYKPPKFENKALHHTDVSLTWDETPADRLNAFRGWKEDMDLEEYEARIKEYIAPPSDSEEEKGEEEENDGGDVGNDEVVTFKKPKKKPFQETIALYRNLLKEIEDNEAEEEKEKREKEEKEKEFLKAIGGEWMKADRTSFNDKKSAKDDDDKGDDDDVEKEDDDEEEGEEYEDESDVEEMEGVEVDGDDDSDDVDKDDDNEDDEEGEDGEEEEEEEEKIVQTKKGKISNRKLVRMKIKERKKQKAGTQAQQVTTADRFKKIMANKDFALDEKVADKTTKQKQRRILSDMKKRR